MKQNTTWILEFLKILQHSWVERDALKDDASLLRIYEDPHYIGLHR